jgi:hypothetical protein
MSELGRKVASDEDVTAFCQFLLIAFYPKLDSFDRARYVGELSILMPLHPTIAALATLKRTLILKAAKGWKSPDIIGAAVKKAQTAVNRTSAKIKRSKAADCSIG